MRIKAESELYISDDNIKRMTVKAARVEELIFFIAVSTLPRLHGPTICD